MRRLGTALLALTALAALAGPASAAPSSRGGCALAATAPGLTTSWSGEITVSAVLSDPNSPVVTARVYCDLIINGAIRHQTAWFTGTAVVTGRERVAFTADPETDQIELCTHVDFGGGDVRRTCVEPVVTWVPSQPMSDAIGQPPLYRVMTIAPPP